MLKQLVVDKMVNRWIAEKGMASRKEASHRIRHLVEEANLGSLLGEMHSDKLKPDKVEMRQYYEENKDKYKDRSYEQAEKEIELLLTARKQNEYLPKYIEELKANAVIEKNYDLLAVAAPNEAEIRSYYENHPTEYLQSESLRVQNIRINAADEKTGREKAEKAMVKIRSGEDFATVAAAMSDNQSAPPEIIERGRQGRNYEDNVFRCPIGEVTPIFRDGDSFYIVKIIGRKNETRKLLSEVEADIKTKLTQQKWRQKMKENPYAALFRVHGKQFTVEQFLDEFDELTPAQQAQYSSFEAQKNLLDQLIVRELLLEKSEDKVQTPRERKELDELKSMALQEMLHKEEVDEKLEVSETEAKDFYTKKQAYLKEPAKAKISVIRVGFGASQDERSMARKKLEEARKKLNAGADFAAIAREYSDDPSATGGGELESWIYDENLHAGGEQAPEFYRTVFKLQNGQLSDIFEFSRNFWLVKMKENVPSRQMTLAEARPMIEVYVRTMKHQERMMELQSELLEKSQLVIKDHVLSRKLRIELQQHQGERVIF